MYPVPHLRRQSWFLAELRARLRDESSNKWDDDELYRALNNGLMHWQGRVSFPFIYTISGGWQSNVYEYTLPAYMTTVMDVQEKRDNDLDWQSVVGWRVYPDASGTMTLVVDDPQDGSARIIYQAYNGPVPTTVLTLDTQFVGGTDTTMVVDNASYSPIPPSGFIGWATKAEVYPYQGVTVAAADVTLNNIPTTPWLASATTVAATTVMDWYVAAANPSAFEQLLLQSLGEAHELFLTHSPSQEIEHHQWQARWFKQQATEFWKSWKPRSPRLKVPSPALGNRRYDDSRGVYP